MKIFMDCLPCFVRQTLDASRSVTQDVRLRESMVRKVLSRLAETPFSRTPPEMGREIHRIIRELSGSEDPYREVKIRSNLDYIHRFHRQHILRLVRCIHLNISVESEHRQCCSVHNQYHTHMSDLQYT